MANFGIFTQEHPIFGQLGERSLVADFFNLIWEHPLVANYGNLAMGLHLVVDLSTLLVANFGIFTQYRDKLYSALKVW